MIGVLVRSLECRPLRRWASVYLSLMDGEILPLHGNTAIIVNERTRIRLGTEQRVETALCWILLDRRVIKGWLNVRLNVQRGCVLVQRVGQKVRGIE